jgi:hypothetical protein
MKTSLLTIAFSAALAVSFSGCGKSVEIPQGPRILQAVNQNLTTEESQAIYLLALEPYSKSSNCLLTNLGWTDGTRDARCFSISNKNILVESKRLKLNQDPYMMHYETEMVEPKIKEAMDNFNTYSQEYLTLRDQIKEKISSRKVTQPSFNIKIENIKSENFLKKISDSLLSRIEKKSYVRLHRSYGIQYFPGVIIYENASSINYTEGYATRFSFLAPIYDNPAAVYYDYKIAQKKNPALNLTDYIQNDLPLYAISKDYEVVSGALKYDFSLDEKYYKTSKYILTDKDIQNKIDVNLKSIYVNYMPKTYKISNNDISVSLSKNDYKNLELTNNSDSFLDVKTVSVYYGENISSQEINVKLPPKGIQTITVQLKALGDQFVRVTQDNQKVNVGLAIDYFNTGENKQKTLHKIDEITPLDVI